MAWLALALFASVGVVVWRLEPLLRSYLDRTAQVSEQRVAIERDVQAAPPKRPMLPPDLEAIADQETQPWAREQLRAAIQDDFELLGDWDNVRAQYFG